MWRRRLNPASQSSAVVSNPYAFGSRRFTLILALFFVLCVGGLFAETVENSIVGYQSQMKAPPKG
jgi:hypothetical protein